MKITTLIKTLFVFSSSFLVALSAHAKTEQELVAEYDAQVASGVSWYLAAAAIAQSNSADCATIFNTWKDSNPAKFSFSEPPNAGLTDAQKKYYDSLNKIMVLYLKQNSSEVLKAPLRAVLLRYSDSCNQILKEANPGLYEPLKAGGFVVDGYKLPIWVIVELAEIFGDKAYILSLSVEQGAYAGASYFDIVFNELLEMDDLDAAKKLCREIENFFIKRKQFTSKFYEQAQAVSKALTSRLVDKKISGK